MSLDAPLSPGSDTNGVDHTDPNHDPYFKPIITLPEVHISTLEEEETVLIKQRAKLFRYDSDEKIWKERGTGDAKLLHHEKKHTVRMVMRRDKTHKLCANHFVSQHMTLKPMAGTDRAWIWQTMADFSDGIANPEILVIKFIDAETAKKWKDAFEESKKHILPSLVGSPQKKNEDSDSDVDTSLSDTESVSSAEEIKESAKGSAEKTTESVEEVTKEVENLDVKKE